MTNACAGPFGDAIIADCMSVHGDVDGCMNPSVHKQPPHSHIKFVYHTLAVEKFSAMPDCSPTVRSRSQQENGSIAWKRLPRIESDLLELKK